MAIFKKAFFTGLLSLIFGQFVFSQKPTIQPYLDAWTVSDTSQTHRSTVFFDELDAKKDTIEFKQTIAALYEYLKEHPSKRLEARILMYDAFSALVFPQWEDPKYKVMLERAMEIAHDLKDDQLMAEIYAYYAEITGQNNHLLYNLKALELQERIGFDHFYTTHNRFFIVSNALYHNREYRQSIDYGLRCLSFIKTDVAHWLQRVYVLQLDILGASYRKLGLCDSSIYYYNMIQDTLTNNPDGNSYIQSLWMGIAKGNIGHCLALQGNYIKAIPLIQEYISNSTSAKDWTNVSMGYNAIASAYFGQQQNAAALKAWQTAYYWSQQTGSIDNSLESSKGIADVYKLTGRTDSALYYFSLYHDYADTINRRLSQSRLSAMHARMSFDNLQQNLDRSQEALNRSRFTLQVIVAGSILLAIILLLAYNHYRLQARYRLQVINRKKDDAELEVKKAKEQIGQFMSNLVEKNNLIESMQQKLEQVEQQLPNKFTMEDLSRYTLVSEEEWVRFRGEFATAYPSYLNALRRQLPQITPAEERLSILIFLQLNTYQLAGTLGISKDSVSRAKRRLRQRLNLAENDNIEHFLTNLLEDKSLKN